MYQQIFFHRNRIYIAGFEISRFSLMVEFETWLNVIEIRLATETRLDFVRHEHDKFCNMLPQSLFIFYTCLIVFGLSLSLSLFSSCPYDFTYNSRAIVV